MKTMSLEQFELNLTFQQVEALVYQIAAMFFRENASPGDKEAFRDIKQEAYLGFLLAHKSFDPDLGHKFTTWVTVKVYYHLKNYFRKEYKVIKTGGGVDAEYQHSFLIWEEFLLEFSKDARTVINLCVKSPLDVLLLIKRRGLPTAKNVRLSVREYLLSDNWSMNRIRKAFKEIKRKLRETEK